MKTDNEIIDRLDGSQVYDDLCISNSIINTIDLVAIDLINAINIENCIIRDFKIHSCWFRNGLVLKNNHILNCVDYSMGGHNSKPIIIEGNIFGGFVNFFDCQFLDIVEVKNNIFIKGTNLLGNQNEGYKNIFDSGIKVRDNIGRMNMDEIA